MEPAQIVDRCLEMLGITSVSDETHDALIDHASIDGVLDPADAASDPRYRQRVAGMLRLIASTREFQLA